MKKLSAAAVLLFTALTLTACLRGETEIAKDAGIGRETDAKYEDRDPAINPGDLQNQPETSAGYTPPPLDSPEITGTDTPSETDASAETPPADGKTWAFVNGKYEYYFTPRDKTAQNDLSDMANVSTAPFEDQPDDWYIGKTSYDESTGEVTYTWDRYDSTIQKVEQYGGIYRGDTSQKVCYFTFDCGYEYGPTGDILDVLKEKQVPGIFFLTGQYVKEEKELIQRMLDEGHIVGNHTVGHYRGTKLTAQQFVDEMQGLEDLFYAQFPDADPMIYYRPPYGNCNEFTLRLADKMGYRTVMWSYTYMDFDTSNQLPYADAMAKVKSGLHPGAVYLFHTESTTNAAILGDFIDWVRAQGYEILPICDIK
ncbi:MAG: polysaccharide deacetylase family protein [Clostridia bacterium]|nr:polysaccharide deacetylase family protein [Clostridia bacterium]